MSDVAFDVCPVALSVCVLELANDSVHGCCIIFFYGPTSTLHQQIIVTSGPIKKDGGHTVLIPVVRSSTVSRSTLMAGTAVVNQIAEKEKLKSDCSA